VIKEVKERRISFGELMSHVHSTPLRYFLGFSRHTIATTFSVFTGAGSTQVEAAAAEYLPAPQKVGVLDGGVLGAGVGVAGAGVGVAGAGVGVAGAGVGVSGAGVGGE